MSATTGIITKEPQRVRQKRQSSAAATDVADPVEAAAKSADVDESIYLIGRPRMKSFLRFMKHHAIDRHLEGDLIAEWQEAQDCVAKLEIEEAGRADNARVSAISVTSEYEPLLVNFLKDPLVQNGFNTVPTEVAMIDLDKLVVSQKHIDLSYVRELQKRIPSTISKEDLFRLCLPYDHPHPPAKWSRVSDDTYVFISKSNDLRYLGTMPLEPHHIHGYPKPGELLGVVGLGVGFGSNYLNAIYAENRLILNNGSHRAFALRDMGLTHVPCVVQHASTMEEFEMIASSEAKREPKLYLKHPRPPMLNDYFNPALRKVVAVERLQRQVKVRFSISEYYVPTL